ncbi:short-chain dehydrogenase [Salipiger aestuarii]|jgi:citronellol/citronellal dehydrogenase|uniref:Peroxisomal trans-2-enoyl-CoA reductase n=2 Tax=Salipiger TaxID=263377 RepID=A0A1G7JEQ6_9RHOB|nr:MULTISPECIES: SDR family oxidoreductase [Salipiger]EIE51226.1 short-chain dehydrogenase/reductase SDR [Citreicella sp. 357]KAA8606791.1 short-chain dehydrogenase [Salipiger aestuarii]KAA8610693.1 short-chain dehydrogenase [Salipiger aestuarii]KAB2541487.1 short-chain dehydrogenase [Salipiger aestuarii]RAK17075.1 citronellol/citronellal dehydrogenase [Salipiger aestuarii]
MNKTQFGSSPEDLKVRSTVFARDLFAGKTAVVTGAGGGLGLAIASLFARLGANLAINGRNEEKLASATEFLEGLGARTFAMPMTIRDPEQVEDFVGRVNQEFGSIDVLVNNAGGQFPQAALDFSPKGWNAVIDTNLNGTWWMMQSMARHWVKHEQPGAIVNIVADVWRGMPGIAHTCAARAGVIYLSKSVAVEWAPHDIRVNCVAPGCCESNGFGNYPEEGAATFQDSNPMRHAGDEWDVAEGVVYMAASSGKFVTGEVLNIDGGQQMWGDPWPTGRPDYFRIS